jgi:hypothetical protein
MLVPAMNPLEITAEVMKDLEKQPEITERLRLEYDRERRNLKIDKTKVYPKAYPIKTGRKNTWLYFFQKNPATDKYRSAYDAAGCSTVYYYGEKGLRVLRYCEAGRFMEVFKGHFFIRYNERLHLNLLNMIDIVKHFFNNNGYLQTEIRQEDGKEFTVGLCKSGFALGNFYHDPNWMVHRTFISPDLKRRDQDEKEKQLLAKFQLMVLKEQLEAKTEAQKKYAEERFNVIKHMLGDQAIHIDALKEFPDVLYTIKEEVFRKL